MRPTTADAAREEKDGENKSQPALSVLVVGLYTQGQVLYALFDINFVEGKKNSFLRKFSAHCGLFIRRVSIMHRSLLCEARNTYLQSSLPSFVVLEAGLGLDLEGHVIQFF